MKRRVQTEQELVLDEAFVPRSVWRDPEARVAAMEHWFIVRLTRGMAIMGKVRRTPRS